jgi:hypothetical protein
MIANRVRCPEKGVQADSMLSARRCGVRHENCFFSGAAENNSQPTRRSVNCVGRSAKPAARDRGGFRGRCVVASPKISCRRGWNHSAAKSGYRKRTRVRVACGGAIRLRGVGTLESHGHFGRSVVGRFLPPVVLPPSCEEPLRRRHFSSGPGLPAAALTPHLVGFVRMSAPADSIVRATRLRSAAVNRATSSPAPSAGASGSWGRRTRPDPRTRLRPV